MSLTTVAKQRLKQGQKVAEGEYIDLLDGVNEIEKLFDAYISLRDDEYVPDEKPAPLTTQVFKDYVRRIHDAIRSTDEAVDAFKTAKDGTLLNEKTPAMNYVDSVDMFGLQLVAGKLVKTVHKVQSGTVSIPSWPLLTGLKLHKFKTFRERMDKVLEALTTRKFICKALFMDEVPMMTRISMQPEEEAKKKGTNKVTNTKRSGQVLYAKENMPKDGEPDTTRPGTGDGDEGDEADDEDTDKDMAPPPTKKRARGTRTPASVAVTINPGGRRSKKPTAARSAQTTDNTASIQPATPAASTPTQAGSSSEHAPSSAANGSNATITTSFTPINAGPSNQRAGAGTSAFNNTGGSVDTAASTPSSPMQTDGPSQSATPDSVTSRVPKQNNFVAFPVRVDHRPAMQVALSALPMGKGELYDAQKFSGPLGKPRVQYGNQIPQTARPGVKELPPAYSRGPYTLPQQPQIVQSPGQYLPQQYQSPGNYVTDQQAFYGYQQSGQRGCSLPQANQQFRTQNRQGSIAQVPPQGQLSQQDQVSAIQFNGQGAQLRHVGQAACYQHGDQAPGFQPNGRVANFQQNGQVASIQQHGPMASVQRNGRVAGIRLNGSHGCSIVNNYFHRPEAESSQALAITRGKDNQYMSYVPDPNNDHVFGDAKTLDDDQYMVLYDEFVKVSILPENASKVEC